ncbi:alpha/beta fold hydrolase [Mucilaginibacter sp. UR6-11]|uniref:alpha/beta fold hydrolase n=1 Tax=Mucilaginibacter sp. UR6-11 TaxID=1435644 RepID=UPI001E2E5AEA|nr:alpha/beta fold hydrolase [Mucilaginibacter sp. UR6-11]MCC8426407.1 alpha/beta fold hydrolase [Mucilaginibacter sp. UR6-11]
MEVLKSILQIITGLSGVMVAMLSILLLVQLRWPAPFLWILKLLVAALSPLFVLIGVLAAIVGVATGSNLIAWIGIYNILIFCLHLFMVTRPPRISINFERAFGRDWENAIDPGQRPYFLSSPAILKLPAVPAPRLIPNITYASIPGTGRNLLCDIWQPSKNIAPSGLAFIYLHGSAWYLLDKDTGTRPLFKHLAAQGHVIMDVAYRLAPEADMMEMVNDVKRAIGWLKENCEKYAVRPDRIVLGGGSAGGHLALLAAYTANDPMFTPRELDEKDLSVCGVISLYGPADLKAMYFHTNQHLTTRPVQGKPKRTAPAQMPGWLKKRMGKSYHRLGFDKGLKDAGALAPLLGGHPDECPETYILFSPDSHIHQGCPPTLLIQGGQDIMAPVSATRLLYRRLVKAKVPVILHVIPQADHAFDLILPVVSPSAHTAFYDIERFLALQASSYTKNPEARSGNKESDQLNKLRKETL